MMREASDSNGQIIEVVTFTTHLKVIVFNVLPIGRVK